MPEEVADVPDFPVYSVDFGEVITYHHLALSLAFKRFEADATTEQRVEFNNWCEQNAYWLEDFALFVALKDHNGGRAWTEWPEDQALRDPDALLTARAEHENMIAERRFRQWLFHKQWYDLKAYANSKGIRLVGDIPIFVAHDSADVWANRDSFTWTIPEIPP